MLSNINNTLTFVLRGSSLEGLKIQYLLRPTMDCAVGVIREVLNDLARYIDSILYFIDLMYSRFLINMPQDEKDKAMKVCAEIEQAYWFYLDFLKPEEPSLPGFSYRE